MGKIRGGYTRLGEDLGQYSSDGGGKCDEQRDPRVEVEEEEYEDSLKRRRGEGKRNEVGK